MFQSASVSKNYSIYDVATLYNERLALLGDKVLAQKKFGIDTNINELQFVRIKNLIPYINRVETVLYTKFSVTELTDISNKLIDCIK